jgi:ABC-type transporter Mla MlaB component
MGGAGSTESGGDAPESLTVEAFVEQGEVRLTVSGRLDRLTRQILHEAAWQVAGKPGDVVVDLRGVVEADAAGVQGLLELWRIGVADRFDNVPVAVLEVVGRDAGPPFAAGGTTGAAPPEPG